MKVYDLIVGKHTNELRLDDGTNLRIRFRDVYPTDHTITVHVDSNNGPVIAAAKVDSLSSRMRVFVGEDPEHAPKADWTDVQDEGFREEAYGFRYEGSRYLWKR